MNYLLNQNACGEKYYIEIPNACTSYKVPKKFLIVFGATLIGIVTSKTSQMDPIIAGTFSGIGSLLINILSDRYASDKNYEVDWLEEFILKVLEINGVLTFEELKRKTNIYGKTLRKTINDLEKKDLICKKVSWVDENNTKYSIK